MKKNLSSITDACHNNKTLPKFFDKPVEIEWLDTDRAAHYLGISAQSLRNMASNGSVKYSKLGRRNRYHIADLRKLIRPKSKEHL